MTQEWTQEPWGFHRHTTTNVEDVTGRTVATTGGYSDNFSDGKCYKENQANARRIVDCVNALAGIPDPAALVASHRQLVEVLESIAEYWNQDRNDAAMHDACWHAVNTATETLATARAVMGEG